MTGFQKILTGAAIVLIGAGVFEAFQASRLTAQVRALEGEREHLAEEVARVTRQRDDAMACLVALQSENEQLRARLASAQDASQELAFLKAQEAAATRDPTQTALTAWVDRVNRLKARLEQNPKAQIPEMQYLTDQDWLNVTRGNLQTDDDYRKALGQLRDAAGTAFQKILSSALGKYLAANNQQFPTDLSQLQPYFQSPVDDSVLQRWQISQGSDGAEGIWLKAPVDSQYDSRLGVDANGMYAAGPAVWAH